MDKDKTDIEKEKLRLNELRNDLIIHYHQDATFYEKRTYIVFFVISGVGLYSCSDLYKSVVDKNYLIHLIIACVLFIIPVILTIISNEFARKKSMYKAEHFQFTDQCYKKKIRKYIKLENGFKIGIGVLYLMGTILLGCVYYQSFK